MRWTRLCGLIVVFWPVSLAWADDPPVMFPKGTVTFESYVTGAAGLDAHTTLGSTAVGMGYYVWDNVSLGVEASGYRVWEPHDDGWAGSLSGVLRQHFFTFDRATILADVSFGPIEASQRIPQGGTYFNFITRTGLGATYQLNDKIFLLGGVRYFHVSNARLEGSQRNPSVNGLEGYVGLMWKL